MFLGAGAAARLCGVGPQLSLPTPRLPQPRPGQARSSCCCGCRCWPWVSRGLHTGPGQGEGSFVSPTGAGSLPCCGPAFSASPQLRDAAPAAAGLCAASPRRLAPWNPENASRPLVYTELVVDDSALLSAKERRSVPVSQAPVLVRAWGCGRGAPGPRTPATAGPGRRRRLWGRWGDGPGRGSRRGKGKPQA